jgi:hypothetical protein
MYCILNGQLCNYAKEWATKLAREGRFEHRSNNKYGENLYCMWSSSPRHVSGKDACDSWYSEIKDYNFGQERQDIGRTGTCFIYHTYNTFVIFLPCTFCPSLK